MADAKKEEVVKKEQPTSQTTPSKKKNNTLLYIILGILVFFIVIAAVIFLVVRNFVKKGIDSLDEGRNVIEQVYEDYDIEEGEDEDSFMFRKSTEEKVDGELEKSDLVTSRFPEDIPLPGGIVTASSYDDYSIEVKIDIDSSVEEIMDWYVEALEEEGWEITSRSSQESVEEWITGTIQFTKKDEERKGQITLDANPYQQVTSIRVRELLY